MKKKKQKKLNRKEIIRAAEKLLFDRANFTVYQKLPYTMVAANLSYNGKNYSTIAFSKCRPIDLPDENLGITIAKNRAIREIYNTIGASEWFLEPGLPPEDVMVYRDHPITEALPLAA